MSGFGRNHRGHRGGPRKFGKHFGNEEKQASENVSDSPVIKSFLKYRNELDKKHDKHERLVKLSRDVTIESKRIIFLLHSNAKGSTPTAVLPEAKTRLSNLISLVFFKISQELEGEDPYQFTRAYYAGVQEFIEAYTFYYYLDSGKLYQWEAAQGDLVFEPEVKCDNEEDDGGKTEAVKMECSDETKGVGGTDEPVDNISIPLKEKNKNKLKVLLTPLDYILGVQDLTGELMRHCINSLSSGQVEAMYQTCGFVRNIYSGLTILSRIPFREFYRKLTVLRQSLLKIENACYQFRIRGSEIPKHMLATVVTCQDSNPVDEDEGFY